MDPKTRGSNSACAALSINLPEILECIASFLPTNDVACGLKLLSKATAAQFGSYNVVKLSQPSPCDAFQKRWCTTSAMHAITLQRRRHLLALTAATGIVANLNAAIRVAGLTPFIGLVSAAAAAGQLHICRWLHQQGWPLGDAMMAAARGGHRRVCEWLLSVGCVAAEAPEAAAEGGHIELMGWLMQQLGPTLTQNMVGALARSCDLTTFQRLVSEVPEAIDWSVPAMFDWAVGQAAWSPTPDWQAKVVWLEQQQSAAEEANLSPDSTPTPPLAQPPSPPPPQQQPDQLLLVQPGELEQPGGADDLGQPGQLAQLQPPPPPAPPLPLPPPPQPDPPQPEQQQQQQLPPPPPQPPLPPQQQQQRGALACGLAASCPDALDRLMWLRQRGYPVDETAFNRAAAAGNLAVLQYLLEEAARGAIGAWPGSDNNFAPEEAAEEGNLAALQLLHMHGWISDPAGACRSAAQSGHLAVVAWLVDAFGSEVIGLNAALFYPAARSGNVELMAWLHDQGCEWHHSTFQAAVEGGCGAAQEWLVDRGCPMPDNGEPYVAATMHGDLSTLACLRRLSCPWGGPDTFRRCLVESLDRSVPLHLRIPVLQWMLEEGCPVDWEAALQQAERSDSSPLVAWLRQSAEAKQEGAGPSASTMMTSQQ